MNKLKNRLFSVVLGASLLIFSTMVNAESSNSDFVDLSFTIDSKSYNSNSIKKSLDLAPFIQDESTLVPFRTILEELGYQIKWNSVDSSITATSNNNTIKLFINNKTAFVNGVQKDLSVAPKIVGERTVVPLRFISESSGANVVWDGNTKTIYITKIGQFNTGKVLFYDEKPNSQNTVDLYTYTGTDIKTIFLENKKIVNWFSFKGKILATMFDKTENKDNVVLFSDENYNILLDNFEIKDTFEFNDNLMIHGYDRKEKVNKLLRFDGKSLKLVEDDFYVGNHFILKDKLIINKYTASRNYSLVTFDKNSWTPTTLLNGFVLKDSLESNGVIYATGSWQSGKGKLLVSYDGTNFTTLSDDISIDLKSLFAFNGKLFGIVANQLVTISQGSMQKVLFPNSESELNTITYSDPSYISPSSSINVTAYIKYNVCAITLYNNKLYIGVNGGSYVDLGGSKSAKGPTYIDPSGREKSVPIPSQLIEIGSMGNFTTIQPDLKTTELRTYNNTLFILGMSKTSNDSFNQPILYIYNGTKLISTLDVIEIKDIISVNGNTFIYIKDRLRITNKDRDNILLFNNDKITNLVADIKVDKWGTTNKNLIFAGYDKGVKQDKLYLYDSKFSELEGSYDIKYWANFDDKAFINGYNKDTKKYSLYRFSNNKNQNIKTDLEVTNIIKLKGNYYLVYGIDKNKKSAFANKNVLYIYNDVSNDFTIMKVDVKVSQMIFVQ